MKNKLYKYNLKINTYYQAIINYNEKINYI